MIAGRGKRGGRVGRLAQRAAKPVIDPCPPGHKGGAYKPLTEVDIEKIYDMALRLLETLGMGEVPDRLRSDLLAAGAVEGERARLRLPREMVEKEIALSAKTFVLHGRDDSRSIEVGGDRVYFGTGGAAVQTSDLETGLYRSSTLADLHDFNRLQDTRRAARKCGSGDRSRSPVPEPPCG